MNNRNKRKNFGEKSNKKRNNKKDKGEKSKGQSRMDIFFQNLNHHG